MINMPHRPSANLPRTIPVGKRRVPMSFIMSLRKSGLLTSEQLIEIHAKLAVMDLPALSKDLVDNGWLTPYQLQRIRDGLPGGLVIGPYRIMEELGRGGFGTVYKALHRITNRTVALKVMSGESFGIDGRKLFLREIVIATRLNHPNIALSYDANETDGTLWFAMELVAGPNLHDFVVEKGPLSIRHACALLYQVTRALQYAHDNGMVHRDIKPGNLLLTTSGASGFEPNCTGLDNVLVKVVDFGFVRLFSHQQARPDSLCSEGGWLGTPEFMSPEQAKDSRLVDIRSDLYSLGCSFYFALTGHFAFSGATATETIALQLEAEPPPITLRRPDVPPDLADFIARLMRKNPAHRFQTPAECTEALAYILRNLHLSSPAASATSQGQQLEVKRDHGNSTHAADQTGPGSPSSCGPMIVLPDGSACDASAYKPMPIKALAELWNEWLRVLKVLSMGRPDPVNDEEYQSIYRALTTDLRCRIPTAEAKAALIYRRLEALVEPWLTRQSLLLQDRATLHGLWQAGQLLLRELSPPEERTLSIWHGLIFLCLFVMLCVVFQWLVR